jgi:hypothetical protein
LSKEIVRPTVLRQLLRRGRTAVEVLILLGFTPLLSMALNAPPPPYPRGGHSDDGDPYLLRLAVVMLVLIGCVGLIARQISNPRFRAIRPPMKAEFLFYVFLSKNDCDAIVGDLEERFKLMRKKFGARKANLWYWIQATRSIGPIAWAWTKKTVMKPVIGMIAWAVAKRLLDHDSWLAALMELWKRIRQ